MGRRRDRTLRSCTAPLPLSSFQPRSFRRYICRCIPGMLPEIHPPSQQAVISGNHQHSERARNRSTRTSSSFYPVRTSGSLLPATPQECTLFFLSLSYPLAVAVFLVVLERCSIESRLRTAATEFFQYGESFRVYHFAAGTVSRVAAMILFFPHSLSRHALIAGCHPDPLHQHRRDAGSEVPALCFGLVLIQVSTMHSSMRSRVEKHADIPMALSTTNHPATPWTVTLSFLYAAIISL